MSLLVRTEKAVITRTDLLLKAHQKFQLINNSTLTDDQFIHATYRRFMRLKPFISRVFAVKTTYVDYVKYKYKYEDYSLKKKFILGDSRESDKNWRDEVENTLCFVLKSVSCLEEGSSADISICKKILKNILTVEYDKMTKATGSSFSDYRIEFTHLSGKSTGKNVQLAQRKVISDFDICLLYLNESLGIRL